MTGKRWTEDDINFLINNYEKLNNRQIGEVIGKSQDAVQLKSRKLGLKKESKYNFNSEFFKEINTHEKAYWLGFIYADGYVIFNKESRQYELGIMLNKNDANHLKKFNKSLNGNIEVTYRKRKVHFPNKTSKIHESSLIRINSKEMVTDLMNYGIVPNKTYKDFKLPKIHIDLLWSFIRGYLDGDGYISLPNDKYKSKYLVGFTSICLPLLNELHNLLKENNITSHIIKNNKPKENQKQCYQLKISDKQSFYKILNNCYKNKDVYLDRKFELYNKAISNMPSN